MNNRASASGTVAIDMVARAAPDYREQLEKQAFEPLTSKLQQFPAFVQTKLDK